MSVLQMLIFFYILTIQDVRSGRTPRAKEHMKKPDLGDTETCGFWRTLASVSRVADFRSDPTSSRGEVEMTLVSKQTPSN